MNLATERSRRTALMSPVAVPEIWLRPGSVRTYEELTSGFVFASMELEAYTLAQSGSLVDLHIQHKTRPSRRIRVCYRLPH